MHPELDIFTDASGLLTMDRERSNAVQTGDTKTNEISSLLFKHS